MRTSAHHLPALCLSFSSYKMEFIMCAPVPTVVLRRPGREIPQLCPEHVAVAAGVLTCPVPCLSPTGGTGARPHPSSQNSDAVGQLPRTRGRRPSVHPGGGSQYSFAALS